MSATPRVRSGAFPQTPGTVARGAPPTPSPTPPPAASRRTSQKSPLPVAPRDNAPQTAAGQPVISLNIIPAPSQRLYACAVYLALHAYRIYDWVQLIEEHADSVPLFLKWLIIDLAFLFGLPELRIPWLELAQPTVITLFLIHAVLNWMLMFNIAMPWTSFMLAFVKVFYDKELSISENYVQTSNILHNHSLIMGKQIINILPEGTAIMNPEGVPFCIGGDKHSASIPLHFNATAPVEVELIRVDLDTNHEESLKLSKSQLREIEKLSKRQAHEGGQTAVQYNFPVKKTGAYKLGKVLDEYKLEVQRHSPYTFVVACPSARVRASPSAIRCLGDLSDLSLQVDGTPPLKIVYSRTINGKDHSFHFQSLQPEGFSSPLMGSLRSTTLTIPDEKDISWARPHQVMVSLNESMHAGGDWQYSVDEVHDAFGNVAKYVSPAEDPDMRPKPKHLVQNFHVQERPRVRLQGCDLRNPLKVAKNKATPLPVNFEIAGKVPDDTSHTITWQFSPIDTLTKSGDHGDVITEGSYQSKTARDRPMISAPGLYTLKSVTAGSCEGEVQEPASCLLLNPLEPKLTLRSEEIPDTCAGNSVGLRVDLDLVGTPPFVVYYDVVTNGDPRRERVNIPGMRYQLELRPRVAGRHQYIFKAVDDQVYRGQLLTGADKALYQDVKPAASANILRPTGRISACLEEQIGIDINLSGDAPFTLEYELLHEGKKQQFKAADIMESSHRITTPPFVEGGEYALALTSIRDKNGCRNFLQDELKISVRRQRPRAAFGFIDGKRKTKVVEDARVKLPLRLTGDGPWSVTYRNTDADSQPIKRTLTNGNGFIDVNGRGTYEIVEVSDNQCPGTVDRSAATFEVDWFKRPELALVSGESITKQHGKFVKQDVCEGDIDGFEVNLQGSPPYHVEYEIRHKPKQGSSSMSRKSFDAVLSKASIQMDTAKAGLYTYKFSALADNLYNDDKKFTPLVLEQTVNAKPSATFDKPGLSFKYCKSEQENEETIPITLTGVPPFYVEIEIKHQSGSAPETYRIPSIDTHKYGMKIPREHLRLGTQHVRIRQVRDARGCQRTSELGGPSVQLQLFDAPAIYPLETRTDYCVGERIAYTLSGTPPFEVWYTFDGVKRRAKSTTTTFRRVAEAPGEFSITSISDKASECQAAVGLTKTIHPLPSVRISKGRNVRVDIHEGGEVEILFEFWGTPPFEFTYTRSTNAKKGQKSQVLETRHDTSYEHSKVIRASQEGTYEVVAIKDYYCAFSTLQVEGGGSKDKGQKLLQY